jgi:hypothetical protein
MTRIQLSFLALIAVQAAHSVEEYRGRLYEVFAPARMVSALISDDLDRGFLIGNVALVAFGLWCFFWPIRRGWRAATSLAWLWVGIELINGTVHSLMSLRAGGYFPGVATAPLLFALALYLAIQLRAESYRSATSM